MGFDNLIPRCNSVSQPDLYSIMYFLKMIEGAIKGYLIPLNFKSNAFRCFTLLVSNALSDNGNQNVFFHF